MAEWLFDRSGAPCLIVDGNRIRDDRGAVVGWIHGNNAHLIHGQHVGWYEGGVLCDGMNCALAFSARRTAYLPHVPRVAEPPALPRLAAAPETTPDFAAAPPRPPRGDWSRHDPFGYFS